jgi:exodeoxyribonuclease VII small subunit
MAKPAQHRLKNDVEDAIGIPPDNYEAALAELETLIARMEEGCLTLEASLGAYRRGTVLMAYCRKQLEKAEQQVRVLEGDMLKPFETEEIEQREGPL